MARLQVLRTVTLCVGILCCLPALAKPAFSSSEIDDISGTMMFGDLDGDHLQDIVFMDRTNLQIFFQDPKQGFTRKPQQLFQMDDKPAIVWTARLERNADSLLEMTSDGVTELCFTNRGDPPVRRQIINQPTIVPDRLHYESRIHLPLSANTGTNNYPLILVPAADGLQVWRHGNDWERAQVIEGAIDFRVSPSGDRGYSQWMGLNLCIQDVNGDGRDDLMTMRNTPDGMEVFSLYLQDTNGLFNLVPAMTYTNKRDWHTLLNWKDINRDGRLDLIKSTISDEPSFIPGLQSGKVLVAAYLADAHGNIPETPQQVFRKADWSAFLPMVDVDGDGFMDLILGSIPIDSRDGVRNIITTGKVDLNLKFHFYQPGQGFSKEPEFQRTVPIYFDNELIWDQDVRIYTEKFLSFNGDFNGDGKKDLLVRDHSGGISVYFFNSRETGFSTKADISFHSPEPMNWWITKDLNNDGVSDLVVSLRESDGFRIFLSQGK